jgi:gamma-glutamyltranspeptidase/glutathione hydrolase
VEIKNQVDPISLKFRGQGVGKTQSDNFDGLQESSFENDGVEVWEHPPNGQGIVALIALGILEELEKTGKIPIFTEADHNSAPYLHAVVEALRIAFADASWWVADPSKSRLNTLKILETDTRIPQVL